MTKIELGFDQGYCSWVITRQSWDSNLHLKGEGYVGYVTHSSGRNGECSRLLLGTASIQTAVLWGWGWEGVFSGKGSLLMGVVYVIHSNYCSTCIAIKMDQKDNCFSRPNLKSSCGSPKATKILI